MTEKLISILKEQNEPRWLFFLHSLTPEEKKTLSAEIKKLTKEYNEFGQLRGNNYGYLNGTDKQRHLLQIASFFCFNRNDYEKSPRAALLLEKDKLNRILELFCPSWFSDYVNRQFQGEFTPHNVNYDWLMELSERGFLKPSKELVVRTLPSIIFEMGEKRIWQLKPENVLKRKISLEEHVWYFFEIESQIHYSERYLNFDETVSKEKIGWISLFKELVKEKQIDRSRLLRESLLASNRNFNKLLSGWFAELFIELQATKEEILLLQTELFSVLSSPHSKVVNTVLQAIKKMIAEKGFDPLSFLDNAPVLLSSDTKATIVSVLMIMEKLAQKHPDHREKICLLSCQVFIQADDDLQIRAAKIIAKHADENNISIKQEIAAFYDNMMAASRKLLSNFYEGTALSVKTDEDITHLIDELPVTLTPLQRPENIDDLIFLTSQAFDNNEIWNFDILISALVEFNGQLKNADIPRLEPSFQRAFNLTNKNAFVSTTGLLDHLLATFFIDYGNYLIKKYPGSSSSIEKIYRTHDQSTNGKTTSWTVSPDIGSYTAKWEMPGKLPFYEPFRKLLLEVLDKIKSNDQLPVLCTPEFESCWISPQTLINRLQVYEEAGKRPGEIDLQIAISRCYLENSSTFIQYANEKLKGEFRELMMFLLDEDAGPRGSFVHRAAWMVASLTKKDKKTWAEFNHFSYYKENLNNYIGQLDWESVDEPFSYKRYDYQAGKYIMVNERRKILRVFKVYAEKEKNTIKNILSNIFSTAPKKDPPMLYEFLSYRSRYLSMEVNDIKRILSFIPNNPEPILTDTINKCLQHPTFSEEGDKKMVIATLQFLYEIWNRPGEMAYLFLATSMLCSDKTAAHTAAELWLKSVSAGKIDNIKLGKIIGVHESIEFAPLKRFTDLASQTLWRVSALHDRELKKLIDNILLQLPSTPIKNLKKLKEIHTELSSLYP